MASVVPLPAPTLASAPARRRRLAGAGLSLKARVGGWIVALFVLAAIVGPFFVPYDPSATSAAILQGPSAAHLLGTTSSGQDVLAELLVGTRATLLLGLVTGAVATALSVVIGVTAGFLGGAADEGLSLVTNVVLVLPALPLLVVLIGYLPSKGTLVMALVLSALGWPWGARVIRAQTLSLRDRDFVAAARETGESTFRVIVFEVMPKLVSLAAGNFIFTVLYAIGTSVGLLFLGVGDVSQWSIGSILYWAQSQNALGQGAWWWFVPPGLEVALFGMGLVLLNFGLDEIGNPRLRDAAHQRRIGGRPWRPADPTPVVREARR